MAKNEIQFLPLTDAQKADCERLSVASGSGWWRMGKTDIPSFVPDRLRPKLDGGVMIVSGSASGTTYLVYAAERLDAPDGSFDIQPFGIAICPSGAAPSMAVVHHGGWPDRSLPIPDDYWRVITSCATASYFLAHPPEGKTSGPLGDLIDGHRVAFEKVVMALTSPASARGA